MNRQLLVGLYIVIGAIVVYRLLIRFFAKPDNTAEKELNEIMNSEKYKVKGQYDSE